MRKALAAAGRAFCAAAEALAYAHGQGIAHGGLEPGSILIAANGAVKVRDFLYGRTARAGLPRKRRLALDRAPWEAPELKAGASPTPAADVYALAALLKEAVGDVPSAAAVRELLGKSFAKDPAARPTARALADALRRIS